MKKGEEIFNALVELERKFWNREDYGEEDIPLLSNAMNFIAENLTEFTEYFEYQDQKESKREI